MALDLEVHKQHKQLASEVEKLQDEYFVLLEHSELNPKSIFAVADLNAKKIELAQANSRLKEFVKQHKLQENE